MIIPLCFYFFLYLCLQMKTKVIIFFYVFCAFSLLVSCQNTHEHKTVVCIPVYGQSLALGEEAVRQTDFDSLTNYAEGRIVTENLDHSFGYFDNSNLKEYAKKLIHYQKRANELTVYSMAEMLVDSIGKDTLICIFPGGQGATEIADLGKGSEPYQRFLNKIENACRLSKKRGWDFVMPALCWMQGETDMTSCPNSNYRELLLKFVEDLNKDVKNITGQKCDVKFICYQTNSVSRSVSFNSLAFCCPESEVPQTLLELVRDNPSFYGSGPMYPYSFVREAIHIDGVGQKKHGILVAQSALDILRHRNYLRGLLPLSVCCHESEARIQLNVPNPPLIIDTIHVFKMDNYGFSVITPDNRDIVQDVKIEGNEICIKCSESTKGCRVRYAINGDKMKSGPQHGPRGNICDSRGNWCWQFDMITK